MTDFKDEQTPFCEPQSGRLLRAKESALDADLFFCRYLPSKSNWAAIREAQLNTLTVKNTGMAVTIDINSINSSGE